MIRFKRGDKFKYVGTASAVINGTAIRDFTGWTLEAQLRRKADGSLILQCDIYWIDAATGKFVVDTGTSPIDLSLSWPLGLAEFDIRFTSPTGERTSTDTVSFLIAAGVTR
jgi:hypothetical protein